MPPRLRAEDFFPDSAFPLYVKQVAVSRDVLPHGHDFVELVYVSRGRAAHRVDTPEGGDASGRITRGAGGPSAPHEVMAGDVFVIAPFDRHAFEDPSEFVVYNVIFTPDLLREEFARLRKVEGLVEFLVLEPFFRHETRFRYKLHLDLEPRAEVESLLERIARELDARRPGFELVAKGCFLEMLVALGRAFARQHAAGGADRDLRGKRSAIDRAVGYIEANFAEPLSLDTIAHEVYLSPHYFAELFKDRTGLSPWQYVTRIRIERARELLRQAGKSITEIAYEVGFGDSSYFAKVFKKQEGMTPRHFRVESGKSSGKS